ncbi:MAG: NAD(P)-binding protein [Congregibacter sp.]
MTDKEPTRPVSAHKPYGRDTGNHDYSSNVHNPNKQGTISRRDFVHDLGLSSLTVALSGITLQSLGASGVRAAATDSRARADDHSSSSADYYPPSQTGIRGAHPGSFEVAHALARERRLFDSPTVLNERYDLVVVGAGISGLAAAYFYRKQHGPDARILLLDNHDDFGGHAKRNEFHQGGDMRLVWGGTVNIEYPNYSEVGLGLLRELGIEESRLLKDFDYNWGDSGSGLGTACWFDRQSYGEDVLVPGLSFLGLSREKLLQTLSMLPLDVDAKTALRRFLESEDRILPDLSLEEVVAFTHRTRYADFLRQYAGLPPEAIQIFSNATAGVWGVRADDLSVAECFYTGLPGAHILALPDTEDEEDGQNPSAMFADGNASIARLLVRSLVPESFREMPADSDPLNIVTARLDYSTLDADRSPVRLRLNSTVVNVENNAAQNSVKVSYVREGKVQQVSAGQCVMACYNRIIPHLCPELPEAQKAGLRQCIKRPMLVVNVLLNDGKALQKSGVSGAYLPGSMLQMVSLVTGINTGDYRGNWNPEEACVLQFFAAVGPENADGLSITAQDQAGRLRLLQMRYEDYEAEVFRVLTGIWGESGLDPSRDIAAITVNRWPHGYARDLLDLEASDWLATPGPYEIGRQTLGNIAIANSDAGADAYTHTAIDQAWRAVQELPRSA